METMGLKLDFKMAYKTVRKVRICFFMEEIADVAKTNLCVDKCVYFPHILNFSTQFIFSFHFETQVRCMAEKSIKLSYYDGHSYKILHRR